MIPNNLPNITVNVYRVGGADTPVARYPVVAWTAEDGAPLIAVDGNSRIAIPAVALADQLAGSRLYWLLSVPAVDTGAGK